MKQEKTLHDYGVNDYPKLIRDVHRNRVKLTAWVQQKDDLYFLPETVLDGDELYLDGEQRARNMRQPSVSGEYEMTGTSSIIEELQHSYINLRESESLVLKDIKLPDGVIGCFITAEGHRWELELARIPSNMTIVEDIHTMDQMDEYQIKTPEFAAVMAVWKKYSVDGKLDIPEEALLAELTEQGFSGVSAKAIDRVCRGAKSKGGIKPKN